MGQRPYRMTYSLRETALSLPPAGVGLGRIHGGGSDG